MRVKEENWQNYIYNFHKEQIVIVLSSRISRLNLERFQYN